MTFGLGIYCLDSFSWTFMFLSVSLANSLLPPPAEKNHIVENIKICRNGLPMASSGANTLSFKHPLAQAKYGISTRHYRHRVVWIFLMCPFWANTSLSNALAPMTIVGISWHIQIRHNRSKRSVDDEKMTWVLSMNWVYYENTNIGDRWGLWKMSFLVSRCSHPKILQAV